MPMRAAASARKRSLVLRLFFGLCPALRLMPLDAALQSTISFLLVEVEAAAVALEHAIAEFVHSLESGKIEVAAFGFQLATLQRGRGGRGQFGAAVAHHNLRVRVEAGLLLLISRKLEIMNMAGDHQVDPFHVRRAIRSLHSGIDSDQNALVS